MNKKIVHWPARILMNASKEVTDEDTTQLVKDLIDTCNVAMGAGLAANQIGSNLSVFVLQPKVLNCENPDPSKVNENFMVCINPQWCPTKDENGSIRVEAWMEGCLSLPGLDMLVTRAKSGTLEYLDQDGMKQELLIEFPLSAAVEHEMDHLRGSTIAHVNRRRKAASLTLSFWKNKREKMARKGF